MRNKLNDIVTNRDMFALTVEDVKIDYRNKLGEGNFCSVYPVHIRDKENQFNEELPPFALKQLNYDIITHPNPNIIKAACDDLANEARIMKELQHDRILPILGMSQQRDIGKDTLFIIVEKLESTLDSKLSEWAKDLGIFRQIISKEDVITRINNVALTIGQGLQYMHSQNCLFRDLKPANIGFDQSGSVKIFDFGLAVRVPTSSGEDTVKGRVGTIRYMAPETRRGERYSYPSDTYAFAILLWQIITARIPFKDDIPTSGFTPSKDLSDDKRPKLKYVESQELRELLRASWETSPEERLTLDEMMPKLQSIGRTMCLSCEEDKNEEKESWKSGFLDGIRRRRNMILSSISFAAWLKTIFFRIGSRDRIEVRN